MSLRAPAVGILLALTCATPLGPVPVAAAAPSVVTASAPSSMCADVIVYVVRGSGEAPQSGDAVRPYNPANPTAGYADTWDAFDPIDEDTGGSSIDADIELDKDEDGKPTVDTGSPFMYDLVQKVHERVGGQLRLSWSPIRYPAIPVETVTVAQPLWALKRYPDSVTSGIRELHRTLKRQWEICGTNTKYVLAGYSQGADVVNSYLRGKIILGPRVFGVPTVRDYLAPSAVIRKQIASVELIADPNHDPRDPESYSNVDPALSQKGGLYGFRFGVPGSVAPVTDSFCLVGDPVCGQGSTLRPELELGTPIHTEAYRNFVTYPVACHLGEDEPVDDVSAVTCAADRIVWRLGVRNLVRNPPDEAASAPGTTGRDVAFFVDTTGSMSDDIDGAIAFAASQADRIVSLDGRVALVQYKDSGDSTPVEIVTPFTSDISQFQAGLSSLVADGGDDEPEGLLHALMTGFNELDWLYGASKAAVVLTDASFHEPDRTGGETLPMVERRSLEIDPVNVFPVVDPTRQYSDLAALTSGEVIPKGSGSTELALSRALDNIAERPVAVLSNGTYVATGDRDVHFDASGSSAITGSISEYRWDTDGDGYTDEVTTTPTLNHRFPAGYSGVMQVLVVDDLGRSANASAAVLVEAEPTRGLVARVPGAVSMEAEAAATGDHVSLDVAWDAGTEVPARWVVAVDGDPVDIADGDRDHVRVPVDYQEEPWQVTVTPMDADGNYGPVYTADLAALPAPPHWYERPVVWLVAAGVGIAGCLLVGWLLLRRRRSPTIGPVAGQVT